MLSSQSLVKNIVLVFTTFTTFQIMKILTFLASFTAACMAHNVTGRIHSAAVANNIDLNSLSFTAEAIASIQAIYDLDKVSIPAGVTNGDKFYVHAHLVPP